MDPQAALDELETILDGLASERDAARDQARDLLNWLDKGGFSPDADLESLARLLSSAGFRRMHGEPQEPTLRQLLERVVYSVNE